MTPKPKDVAPDVVGAPAAPSRSVASMPGVDARVRELVRRGGVLEPVAAFEEIVVAEGADGIRAAAPHAPELSTTRRDVAIEALTLVHESWRAVELDLRAVDREVDECSQRLGAATPGLTVTWLGFQALLFACGLTVASTVIASFMAGGFVGQGIGAEMASLLRVAPDDMAVVNAFLASFLVNGLGGLLALALGGEQLKRTSLAIVAAVHVGFSVAAMYIRLDGEPAGDVLSLALVVFELILGLTMFVWAGQLRSAVGTKLSERRVYRQTKAQLREREARRAVVSEQLARATAALNAQLAVVAGFEEAPSRLSADLALQASTARAAFVTETLALAREHAAGEDHALLSSGEDDR